MEYEEIIRKNYRDFLTYNFLVEFSKRYNELLDDLSNYIANYEKYTLFNADKLFINKISRNFVFVIFMLKSFNLDKETKKVVDELYDKIDLFVSKSSFSLDELKDLLLKLSQILSNSFLKDVVKYVPTAEAKLKQLYE